MQQAALVFSLVAGEEGRLNSAPLLEQTDEGGLRVSSGMEHEEDRTQGVAGEKAAGAKRVNVWNDENGANEVNGVNEVNETNETNVEKGGWGVRGVNSMNSMKGGFVLNLRPAPGEP